MTRAPYVAAIGLSAFLFFSLQLLAGRLVLPVFGGSAGVWTTALSFFTAVLFVGYAYAHLVATRLSPRRGGALHLALAAVALAATLLAPANVASLRGAGLPETLGVLVALMAVVGPAALLLSATTPLLSAWYARHSADPWWLYAASNAASFGALFAYPLLIEPALPLSAQRLGLAGGLALFIAGLAGVVLVGQRQLPRQPRVVAEAARALVERLSLRRQALWLAAAFVPAGLLSATTNFITTDLVSAPLLWVGPLAIYLASFVVAFSARGRRILPAVEWLVPTAATLLWLPFVLSVGWPMLPLLLIELGAFAVLAIAIHGRLALDRPADSQLTRYYLVIAAGGMLATAFVALLAPLVFPTIWEYPILLVAALALLVVFRPPTRTRAAPGLGNVLEDTGRRLTPYAVAALAVLALVAWQSPAQAVFVAVLLALGGGIVALSARPALLAASTGAAIVILSLTLSPEPLTRVRTFYGVIEVRATDGGRAMYHGTTLHGVQLSADHAEPTSYYARAGPVGAMIEDLRERTDSADIGVIGLGVGTIAAYAEPGDSLVFFEIDRGVVDLALDRRFFTYLSDASVAPTIVVGDGRLTLAEQPADGLDLLIVDAFSSDAVPVHLLTREAMAEYARTVRPDGVIAVHLSNRYYDLVPAVAATVRAQGLHAVAIDFRPDESAQRDAAVSNSRWLVAGAADVIARFAARGWTAPADGPILTDDFSDVMRLLRID